MSLYAVVQERFEKIDPECLQTILRTEGKMTRTDAARVARREQGILWERLPFEEAQGVVVALAVHGYAARVVPADALPKLNKPRAIQWLEIGDEALHVPWTLDQQTIAVPWATVFVISAGEVNQVSEKLVTKSVAFDADDGAATETEVEAESRLVPATDLIAIAEDGKFIHVRLLSNELAYDRILGPKTATITSFQRYATVLGELVSRSTAAIVSPKTRRLMVERKEPYAAPRSAAWAGLEEMAFEKYNRWLLQLVVFSEQRKNESANSNEQGGT